MKKLSLITCLMGCSLLVTSCGSGKREYNNAIEHLKDHLKNPDTLKVDSAVGYCHSDSGVKRYGFKVRYDAHNSYGSYGGFETIYIVYDGEDYTCSHCSKYAASDFGYIQVEGEEVFSK